MLNRCASTARRDPKSAYYAAPSSADAADELELAMSALAAGRTDAFSTVYRLSKPSIGVFLRKLGADAVTVEDLTHETLLRVYRARARYREGAKVLTWARTIARRLYIDRLRDRVLSTSAHATFYEGIPAPLACQSPDDLVAIRRLTQAMVESIARLPPVQAEALRMIYQEGMTFSEASERLGTTQVCMRLRSHRACKALRAELDADALHR